MQATATQNHPHSTATPENKTVETSRGPVEVKPMPGAEKPAVTPQATSTENGEKKAGRGRPKSDPNAPQPEPRDILRRYAVNLHQFFAKNPAFEVSDLAAMIAEEKEKDSLKNAKNDVVKEIDDIFASSSPAEIKAFLAQIKAAKGAARK